MQIELLHLSTSAQALYTQIFAYAKLKRAAHVNEKKHRTTITHAQNNQVAAKTQNLITHDLFLVSCVSVCSFFFLVPKELQFARVFQLHRIHS